MLEADFNQKDNFIAGWFINEKVCNDLINYFEKSPDKFAGKVQVKDKNELDPDCKKSTDLSISCENKDTEIINYYKELHKVCEKYKEKYVYCSNWQDPWAVINPWNIQRFKPNEAFYEAHCERFGRHTATRHLVFMTYLNDVEDGGETEFIYQKMKVKPKKGLTLIWGTDWTFLHRGLISPTQTKYITTGWFEYI